MAAARSTSARALTQLSAPAALPRARALHTTSAAKHSPKPGILTAPRRTPTANSSTIDLAYLPSLDTTDPSPSAPTTRIPLLPPSLYSSPSSHPADALASSGHEVMKPEIVTASGDSTHNGGVRAFGEVHDNSAVDVSEMARAVAAGEAGTTAAEAKEEAAGGGGGGGQRGGGGLRRLFMDMVDDVFGPAVDKRDA